MDIEYNVELLLTLKSAFILTFFFFATKLEPQSFVNTELKIHYLW